LNAKSTDATEFAFKVDMFAEAIRSHRGDGVAVPVVASVATRQAVLAAGAADILFCCVDTLEARQIADLISAAFLVPLIDVGVVIPSAKRGAVWQSRTFAAALTTFSRVVRLSGIAGSTLRSL
jgi:hypothetical protein